MADLAQLEAALRAADAAGNEEDARRLAQAYAAARAQQPKADFSNVQGQATTKLDPSRVQIDGQTPDQMSGFNRFGYGIAAPIADTVVGLSQITGIGSPEWQRDTMQRVNAAQSTGAGKVGSVAGNIGMAFAVPELKALKAAPLLRGAASGAAYGATRGTNEGDSRLVNTATGAGLGVAGSKLGSMLAASAQRAQAAIPEATRAIAAKAKQYGIALSPAQLSNSPLVQYLGNQFGILPGAGGAKVAEQQSAAFNRALANTIGVDAPRITPEVYAAKKAADSRAFEALTARNNLTVTGDLAMRLKALQDDANIVGGQAAEATRNAIEGLYARMGADGTIPGKAYQSLDSALGRATKGGGESAHYIGQVRDAIRNAMDQSIAPADREAWRVLRQQYGDRKTLRDLVAKSDGGDLSPQAVMGRVASNNSGKERMASGTRGTLGELAQIGQAMRPPRSSGTAERLMVRDLAKPWQWPSIGLGVTAGRVANSPLLARLLLRDNPGQTRQALVPYLQGLPAATPAIAPFWQQYPVQDSNGP
jgi:hypothetical protein